ncbi:endo-1,3-alpha-glucanase family glycosylhydrolase [Dinghuibacter silviterrae]|uniref:Glycosyl hydrolase family 71 n=1 Tax=Dinghuibacter silviterrae TaxID=1539049 RepID=A0A4R8DTQ3_9BACT|nr:endo-1,3-alpha-glucanase family glycosylhydrolase [Dinghuibacter silviterrae]TDX00815.1 glycosyl hydrolase family 71 [Dinghuibacter silviterrae]
MKKKALVIIGVALTCGGVRAQDGLKNAAALSLPLTDKKIVVAHCMTNIIRYKGHKFEDSCNPDFFSPTGNITASIGGLTQVLPMEDTLLTGAPLDSAVAFDLRAARASGIDAFQFYYPLHTEAWDEIIEAYFRVSEALHIPFSFTFCISHPSGGTQADRVASFAGRINRIMDAVGRDNPRWLRTPDGRLVVYLWAGAGLADIPEGTGVGAGGSDADVPRTPAYYVARAFTDLATAVHERFACIYDINEQITSVKLNDILDYFPACWIWTLPYREHYIGNLVAATCAKRHRSFTGSAFCDFYTSKLLAKGTWNIFSAEGAAAAGLQKSDRKYIVTGLSYNFRKLWEFGIDHDVPVMNIITWNDYPEGHHLAPEINHNEGFSILLNYYKSVWKKEPSPYADRDVAIAFFKQYARATKPSPYDFTLVPVETGIDPASEDSVDVVTLLRKASTLTVNGQSVSVPAGMADTRFFQAQGPVQVAVGRNGASVLAFTTPAWITLHPLRTNRLTYSYSSEHRTFFAPLVGTHNLWPTP